MTATAAAMLAWERAQLGTGETPDGSNRTPYAALAGHPNGYAWCATFQVAAARSIGLQLPSESASTIVMAAAFRAAGRWGQRPMVGALAFFDWALDGVIDHVECVEAVNPDGTFTTIGGNVANAVRRQIRSQHYVQGFGYPAYASGGPSLHDLHEQHIRNHPPAAWPVLSIGADGAPVADLQRVLNARGAQPVLRIDGSFGPVTARAVTNFQATHRLAADGVVGTLTRKALTS